REARNRLDAVLTRPPQPTGNAALDTVPGDDAQSWAVLFCWGAASALGRVQGDAGAPQRSRSWIDEWMLAPIMVNAMTALGQDDGTAWKTVELVKLLTTHRLWHTVAPERQSAYSLIETLLRDEDVRLFLGVNRHEG